MLGYVSGMFKRHRDILKALASSGEIKDDDACMVDQLGRDLLSCNGHEAG